MSLTITTINNDSAAAKTFTLLGRDKTSAEWLNTSDSDDDEKISLSVKQQTIGKTSTNVPIRRTLVQTKIEHAGQGAAATGDVQLETFTVNLTLTGPVVLTSLTSAQRKDMMAYIRNFVTSGVVDQLVRGEV